MTNTWFTSDLHFEHKNIIRYCNRPFATIDEHDEALIANWNARVHDDDTVYILGDFSLRFSAVERYASRLNGRKRLIPGNHDRAHPMHRNHHSSTWKKYLNEGLAQLYPTERYDCLHGHRWHSLQLCHFPYVDEKVVYNEERGAFSTNENASGIVVQLADEGHPLLCGHVHEKWKTKRGPKGSLMINVGVDQWDYAPVSLGTLLDLAEEHAAAKKAARDQEIARLRREADARYSEGVATLLHRVDTALANMPRGVTACGCCGCRATVRCHTPDPTHAFECGCRAQAGW